MVEVAAGDRGGEVLRTADRGRKRHLRVGTQHGAGRVQFTGLVLIGVGDLIGAALARGSAGWPQLIPGCVVVGAGVGAGAATLPTAQRADEAGVADVRVGAARPVPTVPAAPGLRPCPGRSHPSAPLSSATGPLRDAGA
jgi:hypothetical protein